MAIVFVYSTYIHNCTAYTQQSSYKHIKLKSSTVGLDEDVIKEAGAASEEQD